MVGLRYDVPQYQIVRDLNGTPHPISGFFTILPNAQKELKKQLEHQEELRKDPRELAWEREMGWGETYLIEITYEKVEVPNHA